MATETGHHINRVYIDQNGDLHLNSGKVFNDAEADISDDMENLEGLSEELALLAGVTASAAEINLIDGSIAGTAVASKALALGATKNVDTLLFNIGTPAGAGNSQGTGTAMTADTNFVTGADGTVGVVLPVAVTGRRVWLKNTVENQILKVYPAAGADINALGANVAISIPAGGIAMFLARSSTQWYASAVPDGITASATELNYIDGPTPGVATASKAAVLGASQNLDVLGLPVSGLKIGAAGAEVAVTATAANLNAIPTATGTGAEIDKATKPSEMATDGLGRMAVARFTFDMAVVGDRTVAAHGTGETLPINAVVIGGFFDVNTLFTSENANNGTIAIKVEGANDIQTAAAVSGAPYSSIGLKAIVPKSNTPESTGIKLTAAREITCTVGVSAMLTGKLTGFLNYVVSVASA